MYKKLEKDTEAANLLIGHCSGLNRRISVFVRLKHAHMLGDLTEVPIPTRFYFCMLVPEEDDLEACKVSGK